MKLLDENHLMMRQHVADIEDGGILESVSVTMNYEPIIEFKDGKKVAFEWKYLIEQAERFYQKQAENKKRSEDEEI